MPVVARGRRPIVGVPTQTLQSLGGVSAEIPPSWVMSQRYVLTLTNSGAIPWLIPLVDDETLRGVYDALDAVFLPGGADIDPATYGIDASRAVRQDGSRARSRRARAGALGDGGRQAGAGRVSRHAADQSRRRRNAVSGHRRADAGIDQARLLPVQRAAVSRATISRTRSRSRKERVSPACSARGSCA